MRKILPFVLVTLCFTQLPGQSKKSGAETGTRLVVGIVVDQMRNDYIYRYWSRFGNGGFKRLVNEGFYFRNAHFNYMPTYTAPGHASIYTGSTPKKHGIIGNDWYLKKNNGRTYCVQDTGVRAAGSRSKYGLMSPRNLLSSTIGDELKMTCRDGKVFAFALKDRSAILPAGHAGNGAFWYDDATGDFISSTWYMNDLPRWLKNFNDEHYARTYLEKGWEPLYPITSYSASLPDENRYEGTPSKKEKPIFPYTYASFVESNAYGILRMTPFGNTLTRDAALECLVKEQLGKDDAVDMLCLSFSSTDAIAHEYGPRAVEIEDVYLRLDKDLEGLLNALDKEVGREHYAVFLTADHGGADVPNHLLDQKIPAGYVYEKNIERAVKKYCLRVYGDSMLVANVSNEQVFLSDKKLADLRLNRNEVEENLCAFVVTLDGVAEAYSSGVLRNMAFQGADTRALLQNGFNHKLSGNVSLVYSPGWMDHGPKGTTHGTGYDYDTHVPVLFMGNAVKHGDSYDYVTITQIAPTVCELVMINRPNSTIALPLNGYFR